MSLTVVTQTDYINKEDIVVLNSTSESFVKIKVMIENYTWIDIPLHLQSLIHMFSYKTKS